MGPLQKVLGACIAPLAVGLASCVATQPAPDVDNGIFVDAKIYNNRALQSQLQTGKSPASTRIPSPVV